MAGLQHAAGQFCDLVFQFFIGKGGGAASGVLFVHPDFQLFHQRVMLAELVVAAEPVVLVDPVGDTRQPGGFADGYGGGPVQQLFRIENVVDLLVLQKPVSVDACTGDVEVPAHEGRHGGDVIANLVLEVVGDLCDGGGVHAVQRATERGVFKHHGL